MRGRVKFRVGRIVYLAFSRDETEMGFAFPKEWREALVDSEPDKFRLPRPVRPPLQLGGRSAGGDRRRASCASSSIDAWSMVVPKSVAAAYAELHPA